MPDIDYKTRSRNGANANEPVAAAKTRSRPNAEYVLYARGEAVAMNSDDGVNYFGTDILGSVRSVTDNNFTKL